MPRFATELQRFLADQRRPDLWTYLGLPTEASDSQIEERLEERRTWAEAHTADPHGAMEAVFLLVHEQSIRAELQRTRGARRGNGSGVPVRLGIGNTPRPPPPEVREEPVFDDDEPTVVTIARVSVQKPVRLSPPRAEIIEEEEDDEYSAAAIPMDLSETTPMIAPRPGTRGQVAPVNLRVKLAKPPRSVGPVPRASVSTSRVATPPPHAAPLRAPPPSPAALRVPPPRGASAPSPPTDPPSGWDEPMPGVRVERRATGPRSAPPTMAAPRPGLMPRAESPDSFAAEPEPEPAPRPAPPRRAAVSLSPGARAALPMPAVQLAGMVVIAGMALATSLALLWVTFHVKPPGFGGVPIEPPGDLRE